jgi:hypothetical protein
MPNMMASEQFASTLDYTRLSRPKLRELFSLTVKAHGNFFHMWQQAVTDQFGADACAEMTAMVYPGLEAAGGELETVFYQELDFLWSVMPSIQHMLTFARYKADLLPEQLDQGLDIESLPVESLVLLWNVATLTYVMQTGRWTDLISERYNQDVALKTERAAWLDYGGAEEDLRYGLEASGSAVGNVETLLRGFQMAPGEVGLVDAVFELENPDHGFITHKRCPSKDRYGESNRERLESNCVLCVIAMRKSGELVNENMRCRAVDLPPYRGSSAHACKWEYWL